MLAKNVSKFNFWVWKYCRWRLHLYFENEYKSKYVASNKFDCEVCDDNMHFTLSEVWGKFCPPDIFSSGTVIINFCVIPWTLDRFKNKTNLQALKFIFGDAAKL